MGDNNHDGLSYGHFGECIYNVQARTWLWKRDPRLPQSIRLIGSSQLISSVPQTLESVTTTRRTPADVPTSISNLYPEVQAVPGISHYDRVSRAAMATTELYDPTEGPLLALSLIHI